MSTIRSRYFYSIFFFSVFFVKMVISASPIFCNDYDSETIISVILQLEIENQSNSGSETVKDIFSKSYAISGASNNFLAPIRFLASASYVTEDARDIRAFFPSVPTPPPNC